MGKLILLMGVINFGFEEKWHEGKIARSIIVGQMLSITGKATGVF